jgi:hypothetical protein
LIAAEREPMVTALAEAFGQVTDVTPDDDQPLHVVIGALLLPTPWTSPARALARFTNWPRERPEFWVDTEVFNESGQPPRSSSSQSVLGASWRQFSFAFPWAEERADPVRAIQLWVTRFSEAT